MIQDINKSILNPEEASTLSSRLTDVLVSMKLPDDYFKKLVEHSKLAMDDLDAAMARERGSEYSELLASADDLRDNCYLAFKSYVKSCERRPIPAVKEAANRINELIEKYGTDMHTLKYDEQTVKTNLFFEELKEKYQSDIDTMGAGPWVQDMENSQQEFEKLMQDKVKDTPQKKVPTLKVAKNNVLDFAVLLIAAMNKIPLFYPGVHDDKIKQMASVVLGIMTAARARDTRKSNDDGK